MDFFVKFSVYIAKFYLIPILSVVTSFGYMLLLGVYIIFERKDDKNETRTQSNFIHWNFN